MKKFGLTLFTGTLVATMVLHFGASTASSRQQYRNAFAAKYTKPESSDDKEKAFVVVVKETGCMVCHEPGMDRKKRNAYGKELAALIRPEGAPGNERDPKKIDEALTKVAEIHIDEKDPKSPTYGELLKALKLPVEPKAAEKKASN